MIWRSAQHGAARARWRKGFYGLVVLPVEDAGCPSNLDADLRAAGRAEPGAAALPGAGAAAWWASPLALVAPAPPRFRQHWPHGSPTPRSSRPCSAWRRVARSWWPTATRYLVLPAASRCLAGRCAGRGAAARPRGVALGGTWSRSCVSRRACLHDLRRARPQPRLAELARRSGSQPMPFESGQPLHAAVARRRPRAAGVRRSADLEPGGASCLREAEELLLQRGFDLDPSPRNLSNLSRVYTDSSRVLEPERKRPSTELDRARLLAARAPAGLAPRERAAPDYYLNLARRPDQRRAHVSGGPAVAARGSSSSGARTTSEASSTTGRRLGLCRAPRTRPVSGHLERAVDTRARAAPTPGASSALRSRAGGRASTRPRRAFQRVLELSARDTPAPRASSSGSGASRERGARQRRAGAPSFLRARWALPLGDRGGCDLVAFGPALEGGLPGLRRRPGHHRQPAASAAWAPSRAGVDVHDQLDGGRTSHSRGSRWPSTTRSTASRRPSSPSAPGWHADQRAATRAGSGRVLRVRAARARCGSRRPAPSGSCAGASRPALSALFFAAPPAARRVGRLGDGTARRALGPVRDPGRTGLDARYSDRVEGEGDVAAGAPAA